MQFMSYTEFEQLFKARYPAGSFTKPLITQHSITVQFTPGGKQYTYKGRYDTVAQKLGLTA